MITHVDDLTFTLNTGSNSGEQITIKSLLIHNQDDGIVTPENIIINTEIILNSYCNSSTLHITDGALTPTVLRELANALEDKIDIYCKLCNSKTQ